MTIGRANGVLGAVPGIWPFATKLDEEKQMIEPRTSNNNGVLWMVAGILALLSFGCVISLMGLFFFMNMGKSATSSRAIPLTPAAFSPVRAVALPTPRPFIV